MKNNPYSAKEELLKNKKYRIMRIAIVVMAIFVVVLSYFLKKGQPSAAPKGEMQTVTIEIRCHELTENPELLADDSLKGYIPDNGVIISPKEYQIRPGVTTVFQITQQVCMDEDVQFEYEGSSLFGGNYIKGINYIYEFSAGKESGWIYSVDGEVPSYASDKLKLNGGEKIVWSYTVSHDG